MPFKKGQGGRKAGSKNRKPKQVMVILEEQGFSPLLEMIQCYRYAIKIYKSYDVIYAAISKARDISGQFPYPLEDKADKYLKLASDMAKGIAGFTYPKFKSIEMVKVSALDGLTPYQKLEFAKELVRSLEKEVNGTGNLPGAS